MNKYRLTIASILLANALGSDNFEVDAAEISSAYSVAMLDMEAL